MIDPRSTAVQRPTSTPRASALDRVDPYDARGQRRPGVASGVARLLGEPRPDYQPPAWSTKLLYHAPQWGGSIPGQPRQQSSTGGLPTRATLDLMSDDPLRGILGPRQDKDFGAQAWDTAQIALGVAPGEQRGGFYDGIATMPVTMANFPTYGREGLLALLGNALGKDWQQPEGGVIGQEATVDPNGDLLDRSVVATREVGNLLNVPFQAARDWYMGSNNFNRAKSVRDLAVKGETTPFLIDGVTSAIFGGTEKFSYARLAEAAAAKGVDVISMVSERFDIAPDIVAQIMSEPTMSDERLGELMEGQPISLNPVVALGAEAAFFAGTLAVGFGGLKLAAGGIGAITSGSRVAGVGQALGAGMAGTRVAEGAGTAARIAGMSGTVLRGAAKINALNTTAGWSIRGFEWGVKQYAGIVGDQGLADAMDRLLWQMPLSMNPGLNLIDGFAVRPLEVAQHATRFVLGRPKDFTRTEVSIGGGRGGLTNRISDVGAIGIDPTGARYIRIGGRVKQFTKGTDGEQVVGRIAALTPDDMQSRFFAKAGWEPAAVERIFGDGNRLGLTWDDARDMLLYLSLQAVRERKGAQGRMFGLQFATPEARSAAFVEANIGGALRLLEANLDGRSTAIVDQIKGQFWRLDEYEDSDFAGVKARLTAQYIPELGLSDFVSYIRASKIVRDAIRAGRLPETATVRFRRDVNLEYLANFRKHLEATYRTADAVVSKADVERLKRFGGNVESTGKGSMLRRLGRQRKEREFTRGELEEILGDVESTVRKREAEMARPEAPSYRDADTEPGTDPFEDQRVLGISAAELRYVAQARTGTPRSIPPPSILAKVAADIGRTVDSLASLPPAEAWDIVFRWYDEKLAAATETAYVRDRLADFATQVRAGTDADPAVARAGLDAIDWIASELSSPITDSMRRRASAPASRWDMAAEEARALVGELDGHLKDPARQLRPVAIGDRTWAVPQTVAPRILVDIETLAQRMAADSRLPMPDGTRAMLADIDLSPLEKLDEMAPFIDPRDAPAFLEKVTAAGVSDGIWADLGAIVGEGSPSELAQRAGQQATAYVTATEDLMARAQVIARRFQTIEGALSREVEDAIQRAEYFSQRRGATRGNRRFNVWTQDLDPVRAAQRTWEATRGTITRLRRRVDEAARDLRDAEDVLARDPSAVPPGGVTWADQPKANGKGMTYLPEKGKGGTAVARAEATAAAEEMTRVTGTRTRVIPHGNGFRVQMEVPYTPPRPQPVRNAATMAMRRYEAPLGRAEIEAIDNRLESAPDGLATAEQSAAVINRLATADDAYLSEVRAYTANRVAGLRADGVDLGQATPRSIFLGELESRVRAIDRLLARPQQARLEEAAVMAGAPEELLARVVADRQGVAGVEAEAPTGQAPTGIEAKVAAAEAAPEGTLRVARFQEEPVDVAAGESLYVTIEREGVRSAHADLGPGERFTVTPRSPLDVSGGPLDAGVGALMRLDPDAGPEFARMGGVAWDDQFVRSRGTAAGKADLAERLTELYPDTDWASMTDSYTMLGRLGERKAREAGHDVIVNRDAADAAFDEAVVLDRTLLQSEAVPAVPDVAPEAPVVPPDVQAVMDAAARVRQTGEGWEGYLDPAEVERIARKPGYAGMAKADIAIAMEERIRARYSPAAIAAREALPPGVRPATSDTLSIHDESLATLGDVLGRDMADLDAKRWARYMKALTPEERAIAQDLRTRMRKVKGKPDELRVIVREADDLRHRIWTAAGWNGKRKLTAEEVASWSGPEAPTTASLTTATPQGASALPGGPAAEVSVPRQVDARPPEPPASGIYGRDAGAQDIRTERRRIVPARIRLMEADELVTSWDEGYDASLQPRTVDAARDDSMLAIARAPDERLLETTSLAEGTPVVGPDGMTLAGNHRGRALQVADDAAYNAYRAMLTERAAEFGLTGEQVAAMRRPVLVREVPADYMTSEMARALNQPTGGMGITELATSIAREITPDDLRSLALGDETTLATALSNVSAVPFIRRILAKLTERQRGEYLEGDGTLNIQGRALVEAAVISKVLGPQNAAITRRLVESMDSDLGSVGRGIIEAAGQVAVAEAGGTYAIGEVLGAALDRVMEMKAGRLSEADMRAGSRQASMMEGTLTPTEQGLAEAIAAVAFDPETGRARVAARKELTAMLRGYADAIPDPNQMSMFDAGPTDMASLLNAGIDAVNDIRRAAARAPEGQEGMFGGEGVAQIPRIAGADGTTTHGFTGTDGTATQARSVPVLGTVDEAIEAHVPAGAQVLVVGDDVARMAEWAQAHPGQPFDLRMPTQQQAQWLRDFMAGDDLAYRGDAVRAEVDGTMIGDPQAPIPESWYALREAAEGREVGVWGPSDAVTDRTQAIVVRRAATEITDADLGFEPDLTPDVREMEALRDSGRPVVVDPSDIQTEAVAQTAVGAPTVRERKVIVMNEPDTATRTRLAQEARDSAAQRLAEAQARLEEAETAAGGKPALSALDDDTMDLWNRYVGGRVHPTTLADVLDVMESIDHRFPPASAMTDAEVSQLRGSLLAAYHARLDALGAERLAPRAAGERPPTPNRWQDTERLATNEEWGEDIRLVTDEIQRRIVSDDAPPLDGWEGTQYEVVRAPKMYDRDGRPLSPRLFYDSYLDRFDDVIPGIHDEIAAGRRPTWENRLAMTRAGELLDIAVGGRSERTISRQAIDRFRETLMSFVPEANIDEALLRTIERSAGTIMSYWHKRMVEHTAGLGPKRFQVGKYRRVGQVPPHLLETWAKEAFGDDLPAWWDALHDAARKGDVQYPIAEAWRQADNRIRAWFMERPGAIARWVEQAYGSRTGQRAHEWGAALSVGYNTWRFAFDLRWIALEATDAFGLTLGKWGPEGLRAARERKLPLLFGPDDLARARTSWAWWLGVMDTGGWNRSRERYIMGHIKRQQARDFPKVMREMAEQDPVLKAAIDAWDGGDSMAWLEHLAHDLNMMAERGRYVGMEPEGMARLEASLKDYLDRGVISQKEFDESLARSYWTDMPALEKEVSWATDPVYSALIERVTYINQQAWQDAASLIFGQTNRSNLQRLFNSPLLYWPISYQIKATKWLANVLLDQFMGYDTGALGAVTLGQLHEKHKEWMGSVQGYGEFLSRNKQLLFFAQMILPITPWDLGVSLSPFTRMALDFVQGGDADPYMRNLFGVGPGYTFFDLLPRLLREQSQPGSAAQEVSRIAGPVRTLQQVFPFKVGVDPVRDSRLAEAERETLGTTPIPQPRPPEPPENRLSP